MSGIGGRLRGMREKLSSRAKGRRATRRKRTVRRSEVKARHRELKTFDEGRNLPH